MVKASYKAIGIRSFVYGDMRLFCSSCYGKVTWAIHVFIPEINAYSIFKLNKKDHRSEILYTLEKIKCHQKSLSQT